MTTSSGQSCCLQRAEGIHAEWSSVAAADSSGLGRPRCGTAHQKVPANTALGALLPCNKSPNRSIPLTRNHIIKEALRLEKTSKILKSNPNPPLPGPRNHVPKCHISVFLEHLQGWRLHHLPGQLFQCIITLSEKKFFLIHNLNWCSQSAERGPSTRAQIS